MYAHFALNVTDLQRSIAFYTQLFGAEPVKVKPQYAKFLLEDPPLNFTLNLQKAVAGNQVSHLGLQVTDEKELLRHKKRLEAAGMKMREENNTLCCYALQDKFWVVDPDGNEWEFFLTKADAEVYKENDDSCCTTSCCTNDDSSDKGCCCSA